MLRSRFSPLAVSASLLVTAVLGCSGSVQPASPGSGSAQAVAVQVSPSAPLVGTGGTVAFVAAVTGTANTSVTWTVDEAVGGTVSTTGLYSAPSSAGTFHVRATSAADATKSGAATVTVSAPLVVAVAVTPATGAVSACRTLQLAATVTGTTNGAVTWTVQEGAAGGTIAAGGLYTAPSGPGTYHAVATSVADPTKSAVATITVTESITSVAVSPAAVTVPPGGTAQLTATITSSCGTFTATSTLFPNGTVVAN